MEGKFSHLEAHLRERGGAMLAERERGRRVPLRGELLAQTILGPGRSEGSELGNRGQAAKRHRSPSLASGRRGPPSRVQRAALSTRAGFWGGGRAAAWAAASRGPPPLSALRGHFDEVSVRVESHGEVLRKRRCLHLHRRQRGEAGPRVLGGRANQLKDGPRLLLLGSTLEERLAVLPVRPKAAKPLVVRCL